MISTRADEVPDQETADLIVRCRQLRARGQYSEGAEILSQAPDTHPDPKLFFVLGIHHEMLMLPEEAVANYSSALLLDPGNAKYYYNRGAVLSNALPEDMTP